MIRLWLLQDVDTGLYFVNPMWVFFPNVQGEWTDVLKISMQFSRPSSAHDYLERCKKLDRPYFRNKVVKPVEVPIEWD